MPKFAPEYPTIETLHKQHPLSPEATERIADNRLAVSRALGGESTRLAVIMGPCSLALENSGLALSESARLAELTQDPDSNIVAVHRLPPWKPRSDEKSWWGAETSDDPAEVEEVYALLQQIAERHGNIGMEIGHIPHLERYGNLLTFGWQGARNLQDSQLTEQLAVYDPTLPVAIKNSTDGELDAGLNAVERIRRLRDYKLGTAALLYRGGDNARNPNDWGKQTHMAYNLDLPLVVDGAHGGEQAHDPEGNFGKSIEGQEKALEHLLDIAHETSQTPAGVMIEASDGASRTDPVMPPETAIEIVQELAKIRKEQLTV
jgi:phospho-2-dehydro-3-deoxyheptonate aldolase